MGCLNSKKISKDGTVHKSKKEMIIQGNHKENHLHLKKREKASQVHVTSGVHDLK